MSGGRLALEEPDCPLCGAAGRRVLFAGPRFEPHRVVRCTACSFAYLSPRPTEAAMRALYASEAYYEGEGSGYASYTEQERALRRTFRGLLRRLARHGLAGGSLLEIGCGRGYLLAEAAPWFERREGTEFSPQAAAAAAKTADRVYLGGIESVPAAHRYRLIVSSQVIEHVYRPLAFLRAQVAHLEPGGAIAVATPHMGSPWQRALGARWPSFKIPEHVLYFDRSSLAALMQSAGLERIRPIACPHAFPLSLVAARLGLAIGGRWGRAIVWIPWTTIVLVGVSPPGEPLAARSGCRNPRRSAGQRKRRRASRWS